MQGVVYLGESEVEVREFARPTPTMGEVLVEMKAAGLCGSDLHKCRNTREWAAERQGMIAGHEAVGVVAELGPGVEGLAVGERVCVYHSIGCGHCRDCLAGEPVFCEHEGAFGRTRDGSHADFMTTPARYCLPLPGEFSDAVGTQLACTAMTGYAAMQKVREHAGDTLVVFGLGPVGLAAMLLAEATGFRCVGVEVSPYRLELAGRLAKGTLVDPSQTDPVEAVMDLTGGRGAPAVIECSGNATARRQTVLAAAKRGTVVIVGAGADEVCLDQWHVLRHSLTIRGNAVFSMQAYFDAVRFLQAHDVPLDGIVTHRFKLAQASEAFDTFGRGQTGKVIFEWE